MKVQRSNLQSFCRTCLDQVKATAASNFKRTPKLKKLVINCISLDINEDTDALYPQNLCTKCCDTIQKFHEFKRMAQQSDELLRKIVEEDDKTNVKFDFPVNEDNLCSDTDDSEGQMIDPEISMECGIGKIDTTDFANDSDSSIPTISTSKKRKYSDETDVEKFQCKFYNCNTKFKTKKSLVNHVASEHSDELDVEQQLVIINKNLSEVKRDNKNIKQMLTQLTEEMVYFRRELVKKIPNSSGMMLKEPAIIPKHPIREIDAFFTLETDLQDEDKFNNLVRELTDIVAKNGKDFVRKCWHRVVGDEVASNFSWRGQSTTKERADKFAISSAIKAAFENRYPDDPENTSNEYSMRFFQYAQDRLTKKSRYVSRCGGEDPLSVSRKETN